jgi:hypothetical protein
VKTAAQAADRWKTRTATAGADWLAGLQGTSKPIVDAAVAQKNVMTANFADSVASGRWEAGLRAVGDSGIKAAAAAKQGNYATGVQAAGGKVDAFFQKLVNYEQAGLATIAGMPKGNTAAGIARATAWIQYMAAGKGQFK